MSAAYHIAHPGEGEGKPSSHGAQVDKDGIWHEVVYELGEAIVRFVQLQQTQEWAELRWSS